MPVPTNLTPETAILIASLPYSVTLDAFEVPSDELWFRYDKVVGGNTVIANVLPVPLLTGTYHPLIQAFYDDGGVITPYLGIASIERPISTPIGGDVIVSYYWSVEQNAGGPFTEQLFFELLPGPVAAAPEGSFIINDDTNEFPALVISTSGSSLQSFPFPSGEQAAILPSGISLWHDRFNETLALYSAQFVRLATVVWPPLADHVGLAEAPMGASTSLFYVGDIGRPSGPARNAQVTTVDATGALGPTVWDLGSYFLFALAPTRDDTILYYVQGTTGAIKRWDLVGDVALSDLAAGVAGFASIRDILVMGDGSIVHAYRELSGGTPFARRYSAAGATLNTYTLADDPNRLNIGTDGASFWVWTFPSTGTSRFTHYRASDGVVLSTFDAPNSTGGVWQGAPVSGTPQQAHSTSCPFVTVPPPGLPPITFGPPEPPIGYDTISAPQRRLRRAPHLADEQRWMTYDRFQLDLQTGVGIVSGQGEDPQIMLRWSNDGGHTWSNEHWVSAGLMGATKTRAIWRQLGRARTRTFEVVVSDPNQWFLAAAYLDVTPGDGT